MTKSENGDILSDGAEAALKEAHAAWRARGLPCGASLTDKEGVVIARGRNHAFDPIRGTEILEGNPLAHAEMNAIARLQTSHDFSTDTLWSTQQPCSMCAAAIAFCEIGATRYLAIDPAFVGTDDRRAGVVSDPTVDSPGLTPWSILANAMFLQPAIWMDNRDRLERVGENEPEMVEAAQALARIGPDGEFASLQEEVGDLLLELSDRRVRRLAHGG